MDNNSHRDVKEALILTQIKKHLNITVKEIQNCFHKTFSTYKPYQSDFHKDKSIIIRLNN